MRLRTLTAAPAALSLAATALIGGAAPSDAATIRGCDTHGYGGRGPSVTICGSIRVAYIAGTCDPVRFDVRSAVVRVTHGAEYLNYSALDGWTFEVTRGTTRRVVFARYDRTVLKDGDGSVDQGWRSVSRQPQGQGHLSMGGRVDVKNRRDFTASINVDIPPRSGCLA